MYCDVYAWKSMHEHKHTLKDHGTDLSRRDTNFGASVDVDTAVGHERDAGAYDVDNTNRQGTTL